MRRGFVMAGTLTIILFAIFVLVTVTDATAFAQPSGPGTFYQTFTGTDFRPLRSDDLVRFASGTGGGIWVKDNPAGGFPFLEKSLDLPNGVQVSAVTFYVRNCALPLPAPKVYFGSYTPSTAAFTYYVAETAVPTAACDTTQVFTPTIGTVPTVDNSQNRYILGYKPGGIYITDSYNPGSVNDLLVGARVQYQGAGVLLPLIQR